MKRFSSWIEFKPARQRSFEFLDRSRRRQRWFKLGILATTGLAIALIFGFVPKGRYIAASVARAGDPNRAVRIRYPHAEG